MPKMGRAVLSVVLLLIAVCCGYFALATMEMAREINISAPGWVSWESALLATGSVIVALGIL